MADDFVQCQLRRNGAVDVAWIPERVARVGATLRLPSGDGWRVSATWAREAPDLVLDRASAWRRAFPSIEGTAESYRGVICACCSPSSRPICVCACHICAEDVPSLVAEVRRLRAALETAREMSAPRDDLGGRSYLGLFAEYLDLQDARDGRVGQTAAQDDLRRWERLLHAALAGRAE